VLAAALISGIPSSLARSFSPKVQGDRRGILDDKKSIL
jgi:hypothetical protein